METDIKKSLQKLIELLNDKYFMRYASVIN